MVYLDPDPCPPTPDTLEQETKVKLKDRVAIVTGSSRGIGKGLAIGFAKEGAKVVVMARTDAPGRSRLPGTIHETAEQIRATGGECLPIRCDLTSAEDRSALIRQVIDAYDRIDVLVNNAAIILHTNVADTTVKRWGLMAEINVRAPIELCMLTIPHMMKQKSGSIINVSSAAAHDVGALTLYGAADAALDRFTQGLAREMKDHNVAVNGLDPGQVKTEGALFTYPEDTDWSSWKDPAAVVPSAAFLAALSDTSFTGKIVQTDLFGKSWP